MRTGFVPSGIWNDRAPRKTSLVGFLMQALPPRPP